MNKPELISFSDHLMIAPFFDQRQFFAPELEQLKGGLDSLMQSGLIKEDQNRLIEIQGKTALLKIEGPLRPGKDWYYSVGYGDIQSAIIELIDNEYIETVIQVIDSPGGTVKGAFETYEMFQELAKEKNLIAIITGSATSAGALLTFPAKKRYLASKTAQTGSIGVVAEHVDNRIWYKEMWGEVHTSVAKGDLKDAGTDVRGYDAKAKQVFEGSVNKLYEIFADETAKGLGITREAVDSMQSAVFIGAEGIEQGFADGFSTLEHLIEQSNTVFTMPERPAFLNHTNEVNMSMDINKLEAEHPDVYQAAFEKGKQAGLDASSETAKAEGQSAGILLERKRMNDIDALALPSEFAAKAKAEDWSAEKAAAEYLRSEAKDRKQVATDIEGDLKPAVASDVPEMPKSPEPVAKTPEQEWEASTELRAEFGQDKERYLAFVKADEAGRAKILNKGGV